MQTAVCCLFPLHFFYTFLYYTDVGSILFTLSAWLAATKERFILASLLGAGAVLMRQTNSVWVAFIVARAALELTLAKKPLKKEDKGNGANNKINVSLTSDIMLFLRRAWALKYSLLAKLWPLISIVLLFAAFVVLNGGIVVGDKANHTPVRHLMQPLYCALYFTICSAPVFYNPKALLSSLVSIFAAFKRNPLGFVAIIGVLVVSVSNGTLVHPFLLADNRHYTFYFWRKVINRRPWVRYAFIPAYFHSLFALNNALAQGARRPIERLLLAGTAAVVVVPAHLIEFRYFTMVFYAVFLLIRTPSPRQLMFIVSGFVVVNAVTLYVFAARPYTWGDGSIARFMW